MLLLSDLAPASRCFPEVDPSPHSQLDIIVVPCLFKLDLNDCLFRIGFRKISSRRMTTALAVESVCPDLRQLHIVSATTFETVPNAYART